STTAALLIRFPSFKDLRSGAGCPPGSRPAGSLVPPYHTIKSLPDDLVSSGQDAGPNAGRPGRSPGLDTGEGWWKRGQLRPPGAAPQPPPLRAGTRPSPPPASSAYWTA